jgi:glycosyltransferase involved in cell wall biosynthesis
MKIAIMGVRGLPLEDVSFGGFEAFVAGLAPRLARRGHDVTVYCRRDLYRRRPAEHSGVRLRYVTSIENKVLGTPLHTWLCALDAARLRPDAILMLNSGNGFQCIMLRAVTSARLALNVDGVEWERGKWGRVGRAYFRWASRWGARLVHVPIVDSRAIGRLYSELFAVETTFIPYAVDVYTSPEDRKVRAAGLSPGNYGLIVGRLIPENHTDVLVEGFQHGLRGERLVVVGASNYEASFHRRLRAIAGDCVTFLGHVHDQDLLWQLFRHSRVYLHGHSVGGTNPALLQALAAGCAIAATDVVFNREVVSDTGCFFEVTADAVARVARKLWDLSPGSRHALGARAQARVVEGGYTWDRVVTAYEAALAGRRSSLPSTDALRREAAR